VNPSKVQRALRRRLWQIYRYYGADWISRPRMRATVFQHSHWHLTGTAVFAHSQLPCRLDYLVVCNSEWQTVSEWSGWAGNETVEIEFSADSAHRWRLNGAECSTVAGCIDLDLNFSPSTTCFRFAAWVWPSDKR